MRGTMEVGWGSLGNIKFGKLDDAIYDYFTRALHATLRMALLEYTKDKGAAGSNMEAC